MHDVEIISQAFLHSLLRFICSLVDTVGLSVAFQRFIGCLCFCVSGWHRLLDPPANMEQVEEKIEVALHLNHPGHQHGGESTLTGDLHEPTTAADAKSSLVCDSNTLAKLENDTAVNSFSPSERQSSELQRDRLGVDVIGAEKEFAELQRQLSKTSQISRTQSRRSLKHGLHDVEKAVGSESSEDAEPFDLENTLRGNRRLEEGAGIKSKQIGVIWDGLTVRGLGGSKIYVQTFPDAFTNFALFPFRQVMKVFGLGRRGKEVKILRNFRGEEGMKHLR